MQGIFGGQNADMCLLQMSYGKWRVVGGGGWEGGETRYKENHFYSLPFGQAEASIY